MNCNAKLWFFLMFNGTLYACLNFVCLLDLISCLIFKWLMNMLLGPSSGDTSEFIKGTDCCFKVHKAEGTRLVHSLCLYQICKCDFWFNEDVQNSSEMCINIVLKEEVQDLLQSAICTLWKGSLYTADITHLERHSESI